MESKNKKWKSHLEYPERTMYEMVAAAAVQYGDLPALDFYGRVTDYKEFLQQINQAAEAFSRAGIGPGDVVTICMPNTPQALVCFYAVNCTGAAAGMVHPLSAQSEITFYLNDTKSKMILTADLFYEKTAAAVRAADRPVTILTARIQDALPAPLKLLYLARKGRSYLKYPNDKNAVLWRRFITGNYDAEALVCRTGTGDDQAAGTQKLPAAFEKDRVSVILYSGGTSGTPKGICLSDYNMNALAIQCREAILYPFRPGLKMLSCMPLFHGFGLGINLHTVLAHGACCVLMPTFTNKTYAAMLLKKKPNFIAGVPTIYKALLASPKLQDARLDFLMGVFCGGDSMTTELKHKLDAFLTAHGSPVTVQEGYGLTECVTASCLTPLGDYKEGSIGLPFSDMEYDIVEPGTKKRLPAGTEGEIILTGPTLMLGYLNQPEETARALRKLEDGRTWLYSGDLGHMDEEGYVYFRQRIKRMIITHGYNVYPGQIENVIDKVEGVAACCVIGVPDERRGQRVRAYVEPVKGLKDRDGLKERILAALQADVAGYAQPREILLREELPKTLVGKVAFRKLEEEAAAEIDRRGAGSRAEAQADRGGAGSKAAAETDRGRAGAGMAEAGGRTADIAEAGIDPGEAESYG